MADYFENTPMTCKKRIYNIIITARYTHDNKNPRKRRGCRVSITHILQCLRIPIYILLYIYIYSQHTHNNNNDNDDKITMHKKFFTFTCAPTTTSSPDDDRVACPRVVYIHLLTPSGQNNVNTREWKKNTN